MKKTTGSFIKHGTATATGNKWAHQESLAKLQTQQAKIWIHAFLWCCTFRIWLSGEVDAYLAYSAIVGGNSVVAGLLLPPDDSAVTPPLSAHHVVAMPKLTEDERQSPLGSTLGYLTGLSLCFNSNCFSSKCKTILQTTLKSIPIRIPKPIILETASTPMLPLLKLVLLVLLLHRCNLLVLMLHQCSTSL